MPSSPKLSTAYGWWVVGGLVGFHRMYLGWTKLGGAMLLGWIAIYLLALVLELLSVETRILLIAVVPLTLLAVLDLFLMPSLVARQARQIAQDNPDPDEQER
ncbi:MAG: hypothetical protein QNJ13_05055 [Paracoccaceae bacterium]|nr:hypothetical protein [Paracoccaceae bacterium]